MSKRKMMREAVSGLTHSLRHRRLPTALQTELTAMSFVAETAVAAHPPIYRIFRTTGGGARVVDWESGLSALEHSLRAHASLPLDRCCVAREAARALASLSGGKECCLTVTIARSNVHALATSISDIDHGDDQRCLVHLAVARSVVDAGLAMDAWRTQGWMTPTLHPSLSVEHDLPDGAEDAILLYDDTRKGSHAGTFSSGDAVFAEGINSNIAVLLRCGGLSIGCHSAYTGKTAQILQRGFPLRPPHARRQTRS